MRGRRAEERLVPAYLRKKEGKRLESMWGKKVSLTKKGEVRLVTGRREEKGKRRNFGVGRYLLHVENPRHRRASKDGWSRRRKSWSAPAKS